MAAGQPCLQRSPDGDGPVLAHGMDDSSFNIEGIADHIAEAELLCHLAHMLEERKAVLVTTFDHVAIRESDRCVCQLGARAERFGQPQRCIRSPPEVRSTALPPQTPGKS